MANEKLRAWQKENGVSDAEIMLALGLTSVNQFLNRMNGRTDFSPLEQRTLAEYTGISIDELFKRG